MRIIAGAGTGKTRVLTYRVAYLVTNFNLAPSRIVAITFTNKAANELKERVKKILTEQGLPENRLPLVCTFHSFCYRFLRREIDVLKSFNRNFVIVDDDDSNDIKKNVCEQLDIWSDKERRSYLFAVIGHLKSEGITCEEVEKNDIANPFGPMSPEDIIKGYKLYQQLLMKNNALDFDDLLIFTVQILKEHPDIRERWQHHYDAFLVDEFQDTNKLQYDLVKLLLRNNTSLSVVGDPDQTIYTWRGANVSIITDQLKKDFPDLDTVTLDLNYRSTQNILDKANVLIKNNNRRLDKSLTAASGVSGDAVEYKNCLNEDNQADYICNQIISLLSKGAKYQDITVIYRSNYLSRSIEKCLNRNQIPYVIYGGLKFYERQEVKAALAYLRLLVNPKDDFSFKKIIQFPKIGLGDKGLAALAGFADKKGESIWEVILDTPEIHFRSGTQNAIDKLVDSYKQCLEDLKQAKTGADYSTYLFKYFDSVGLIRCVQELDKIKDKNDIDADEKDTKLNNVKELLTEIKQFIDAPHFDSEGNKAESVTLTDFLIDVALQTSQDVGSDASSQNAKENRVKLMTAHVSKGLEFPYVFVVSLDQDVFPSKHADTPKAMEEERRLFYVAMTRAEKNLYLYSFSGEGYDGTPRLPSQFLKEIGFNPKIQTFNRNTSDLYSGGYRRSSYGGYYSSSYSGGSNRGTSSYASTPAFTPGSVLDQQDQMARSLLNARPRPRAHQTVLADSLSKGDKIAHVTFGVGTILDLTPTVLTVQFPDPYGVKKIGRAFNKVFKKVS